MQEELGVIEKILAGLVMTDDQVRHNQVQNIIRRSQTLILNIKLLGADTTQAKQLLDTAKTALDDGDFETAIEYAKKSMVEVMELKKQVKPGGEITPAPEPTPEQKTKKEPTPKPTEPKKDVEPESETTEPEVEPEVPEPTQADADLPGKEQFENGFSYLIEENRADMCFKVFSDLASSKHEGLCICRTNPNIIRRKYNLKDNTTMLWLTDRESSKESTISPSLESMIYVAEEFIDKNDQGIILLDGLEYLISNNSFNPVLRFIRRLIDKISETSSILIIGGSPKAINEQELKLLERELNPIIIE